MTIDIIAVLFVAGLAVFGWIRGLISQVATVGAAVGLWLTRDLWGQPMDGLLQSLGPALAEHPFLRRIAGFLLLYVAIVLLVAAIEYGIVRRLGPLRLSNHWAGAALGGVKGVVYAVVLVWLLQTVTLWRQAPGESAPSWLTESRVVGLVGPWNPVRLFTLREVVDEALVRARRLPESGGPDADGEARSAAGEGAEAESVQSPEGAAHRRLRRKTLEDSESMQRILEEARELEGWSMSTYRQLARNPRVRAAIRDPGVSDLLFGN